MFQSAQKIFGGDLKNHILLFMEKSDDKYDSTIKEYKEAATEFKGKVSLRCIHCLKLYLSPS